MDMNNIRVVITVACFAAFIGIVWWAYGARRQARFDRAARSVLEEDDDVRPAGPGGVK